MLEELENKKLSKDEKKIYAYDCFDTLLLRDCTANQVLIEWARNMAVFLNFSFCPEYLLKVRIEAEVELKKKRKVEELNYSEIIKYFYKKLIKRNTVSLDLKDVCEKSYQLDLEIEKKHSVCNQTLFEEIKRKHEKSRVIVISDFYHNEAFLTELFAIHDMMPYIDKIYVSSDYGFRKSTLNLYKYVLSSEKIHSKELIMTGDNELSDYKLPKSLGIECVLVRNNSDNTRLDKNDIKRCLLSEIKNWNSIFDGFGLSAVLFVERIYKNAIKDNCELLLFCSREGQLLKKLFDLYQRALFPGRTIKTEYIYVSRRSTLLPSLYGRELNRETFKSIIEQFSGIKLYDFLYSLQFDDSEMEELFSLSELHTLFVDSASIEILLNNEKLRIRLMEKAQIQYTYILKYLMDYVRKSKIFIVDVGWKGSIQDNISRILGSEYEVHGYYYGLKMTMSSATNIKKGLMFDMRRKKHDLFVYSYDYGMLENIFVANHGPVMKYEFADNKVVPILSNDPETYAVYSNFKDSINSFEKVFNTYVGLLNKAVYLAEDVGETVSYTHLWNSCIYRPRQFKAELDIRRITKENFGNISNVSKGVSKVIKKDKKMRRKYLFVNYTYRVLEKYELEKLYWSADLYNRFVFWLKYIELVIKRLIIRDTSDL